MEFKIQEKPSPNTENYDKEDIEIAYKFSGLAYKEFGAFIKGIILFGSSARHEQQKESDVDLLMIIDDISMVLTPDMVEAYKIINEKIIMKVSRRIHLTTLKFTSFWEYTRAGDPIAVNMLRDAVPIIDSGFFAPLQMLLYQGRIRPTPEAIYNYFTKAPRTLGNSRWHINSAVLDLYWAAVDAAHAAIMTTGEIPPSPSHVADSLERCFVKTKRIKIKYSKIMRELYKVAKMIMHHEIKEVKGDHYERYYSEAHSFVDEMKKIIDEYSKKSPQSIPDPAQNSPTSYTQPPTTNFHPKNPSVAQPEPDPATLQSIQSPTSDPTVDNTTLGVLPSNNPPLPPLDDIPVDGLSSDPPLPPLEDLPLDGLPIDEPHLDESSKKDPNPASEK